MSTTGWVEARWAVGLLVIAVVFVLIHRLERQIKTRGALFPGSRPAAARRLALLLGLFVIGFCTVCWLSGVQLYQYILLGFGLIGYGLDCGFLLDLVQGAEYRVIQQAAEQAEALSPAETRCRVVIGHN